MAKINKNKIALLNKLKEFKAKKEFVPVYSEMQDNELTEKMAEFDSRKKIEPIKHPKNLPNLSNRKNAFKAPKGNKIPDRTTNHDEYEVAGKAAQQAEKIIGRDFEDLLSY